MHRLLTAPSKVFTVDCPQEWALAPGTRPQAPGPQMRCQCYSTFSRVGVSIAGERQGAPDGDFTESSHSLIRSSRRRLEEGHTAEKIRDMDQGLLSAAVERLHEKV